MLEARALLAYTAYSDRFELDTDVTGVKDVIPRYVQDSFTHITSSNNGYYDDGAKWSGSAAPATSDLVVIDKEITIRNTSAIASAIEIRNGGKLIFDPSVNTQLQVGTLTILPGGELRIGSSSARIASSKTAELVFRDYAWDQSLDKRQFGHGLLAFGDVTIYGAEKGDTWRGLDDNADAGDTSLTLKSTITTWPAGDTIVIPDTRQSEGDLTGTASVTLNVEERTIGTVSGTNLPVTSGLSSDHLGVTYSQGTLRGHVANITRNVIVRSASAGAAVRGHTFFGGTGTVEIHDALFSELGRTDMSALDNSTFNAEDGSLATFGSNQNGRYAVHFHHFIGPASATDQYVFEGNAVVHSKRWALAIHDTSYGLVTNNVFYDAQGAGIVTEAGSEIGNDITDNISIKMWGTGLDGVNGPDPGGNQSLNDMARGGVGFWFRRTGNTITGNVAADSRFAGYVFDSYYLDGNVNLPTSRGADHTQTGNFVATRNNSAEPIDGNTAYGMSHHGFWAAYMTGNNVDLDEDLRTTPRRRCWSTT